MRRRGSAASTTTALPCYTVASRGPTGRSEPTRIVARH